MTRANILFVDDDASVLQALMRRFRSLRREWAVMTAHGGPAALELLETQALDVVVTDMRMPGMDGLTLLGHVRAMQPHALRIILSGQMGPESDTAPHVAHHHLTKPCDAREIIALIERHVVSCHQEATV
ncbi:MAG: hypothetical protein JWO86_9215 [Myxococcaceae bacterium]|jgi:CheY-like chemotaxis protein|nr:hypothetical protein [Myxococcaceae bacterium]MEA2747783.1 hypothetical protein [Myxococcales bacterium]